MTPPMGGMGGGANMQGMNEQEQMMVKGVCPLAIASWSWSNIADKCI